MRTPRVHSLSRSAWLRSATLRASVLTITTKPGAVLVYGAVPCWKLAALLNSKSPGGYFQREIKGRHPLLSSIPAPAAAAPKPEQDLEALLRKSLRMRGVEA